MRVERCVLFETKSVTAKHICDSKRPENVNSIVEQN